MDAESLRVGATRMIAAAKAAIGGLSFYWRLAIAAVILAALRTAK